MCSIMGYCKAKADLAECRLTAMPAVLLELGFMDSATDSKIILTEDNRELLRD